MAKLLRWRHEGVPIRQYIRHPSDIPIEFMLTDAGQQVDDHLKDISIGGLSFRSVRSVPVDTIVQIEIPLVRPQFRATARVVWCHSENEHYDVGVEFLDRDEAYGARIVEQVCHIEHYRQEVLQREGRVLSSEEAAFEWIRKYAETFPKIVDTD